MSWWGWCVVALLAYYSWETRRRLVAVAGLLGAVRDKDKEAAAEQREERDNWLEHLRTEVRELEAEHRELAGYVYLDLPNGRPPRIRSDQAAAPRVR